MFYLLSAANVNWFGWATDRNFIMVFLLTTLVDVIRLAGIGIAELLDTSWGCCVTGSASDSESVNEDIVLDYETLSLSLSRKLNCKSYELASESSNIKSANFLSRSNLSWLLVLAYTESDLA